ncbi:hypothetical protein AC1031_015775 [Aphanomyces cochlioides]|nr:hypothetical protein AC1031_015775 [Aphanomyces cochlioides]
MRYDYAWRHGEFGSKVDRLTGICLRFLYMATTWRKPSMDVASDADDKAAINLRITCRSTSPSDELTAAVQSACQHLNCIYTEPDEDAEAVDVTFCYMGPSELGRVEEALTTFPMTQHGIYLFLLGDAAWLQPPISSEDERRRGLSAFGLGQQLREVLEPREFHAAAHFVCDFKPTPHTTTLGQMMDQFSVPQSNLMIHTEKWDIFVHKASGMDTAVDAAEDAFWQAKAKGVVCDNCHQTHVKLLRCVRCRSVFYCSRECQKEAWKLHKGGCHPPTQTDDSSTA